MFIFSAITPHSPLLIPSIGKENLSVLKKTQTAMEKISADLYSLKPDIVIIISPHGQLDEKKIIINQAPFFKSNFNQFGDLITNLEWAGDMGLAYKIYQEFETTGLLGLIQEEKVDHGVSIPLFYLTQNLKNIHIIPINYSLANVKQHFMFGEKLAEVLKRFNERIAIVASGDLSHRLTKDSPSGYVVEGKKFDKIIIDSLKEKNYQNIINIDPQIAKKADQCGWHSIALLLGILNEINLEPTIISYEGPFGIGHLVAEFV